MATIVLSSEDEDDCIIVDSRDQVSVQPPHTLFILEKKELNDSLLKEDDLEDNEVLDREYSCITLYQEESENILPEVVSSPLNILPEVVSSPLLTTFVEDEIAEELTDFNPEPNIYHQSFYDEDTYDLNNYEGSDMNSNVQNHTGKALEQDNNVIFQRLAAELTKVLSSSLDVTTGEAVHKQGGDSELSTKENINVNVNCNAGNSSESVNSEKRNIELLNKISSNSQSLNISDAKYISVENTTANVKKRPGRKLGWRKNPNSNSHIKDISVNNHTSLVKKRPGRRKRPESNSSLANISEKGITDNVKKRPGRKPGWRKNPELNSSVTHISEKSTTDNVKKRRGRKPGWRRNTESNYSVTHILVKGFTDNVKKRPGRKPGWRKQPKLNSSDNIKIDDNSLSFPIGSNSEINPNEIMRSNDITNRTECANKPPRLEKANQDINVGNGYDQCIVENDMKCVKPSSLSNGNSQLITNDSVDLLKSGLDIILNNLSPSIKSLKRNVNEKPKRRRSKSLHNTQGNGTTVSKTSQAQMPKDNVIPEIEHQITTNGIKIIKGIVRENNALNSDLTESNVTTFSQATPPQNLQPVLTENIEKNLEILKEDFVRCYNKVFDANTEFLCRRLGDLLLSSLKEDMSYTERMTAAEKLTSEQLKNREIHIAGTSFINNLKEYRSSFCTTFHKMLYHIMSDEEVFYQRKALLLTLFLKMFLRVSSLSPEFSDSLIPARNSLTNMLQYYIKDSPESIQNILYDTFWKNDTEFERNSWFILDFCLTSSSVENSVSNESSDKGMINTNSETVTPGFSNILQTQFGNSHNDGKVSVIVQNYQHYSSIEGSELSKDSSNPSDRQELKNNSPAISNSTCEQRSSTSMNNGSVQDTSKTIKLRRNSTIGELIEGQIMEHFTDKEPSSFTERIEGYEERLLQNYQQASSINLQPSSSEVVKENTTQAHVGIKRKASNYEDCLAKIVKTTEIPASNVYSQRNFPMNTPAANTTGWLQQLSRSYPSEDTGSQKNSLMQHSSFPFSHCGSKRSDCTIESNIVLNLTSKGQNKELISAYSRGAPTPYPHPQNVTPKGQNTELIPACSRGAPTPYPCPKNVSPKGQTTELIPACSRGMPPPYPYPQNNTQLLHGHFLGTFNETIQSNSQLLDRNYYNEPKPSNTPRFVGQQNVNVHKLGYNVTRGYPSYVQQLNYQNQRPSQSSAPYTHSYVNYQTYHNPYPNKTPVLYGEPNPYPNKTPVLYGEPNQYPNSYSYNTYRTDPGWKATSVNSPSETPYANTATQNIYASSVPRQVPSVKCNSGITINNYNITTYVPPMSTEHMQEKVSSPHNINQASSPKFDTLTASQGTMVSETVPNLTLHHKPTS